MPQDGTLLEEGGGAGVLGARKRFWDRAPCICLDEEPTCGCLPRPCGLHGKSRSLEPRGDGLHRGSVREQGLLDGRSAVLGQGWEAWAEQVRRTGPHVNSTARRAGEGRLSVRASVCLMSCVQRAGGREGWSAAAVAQ
eukprot:598034-Heterocapsa_arctica.AAC.1